MFEKEKGPRAERVEISCFCQSGIAPLVIDPFRVRSWPSQSLTALVNQLKGEEIRKSERLEC